MAASKSSLARVLAVLALAGLALWLGARFLHTDGKGEGGSLPAAGSAAPEDRSAEEWYARGTELLNEGKDLARAAEAYRNAIEAAPSMGAAHYGLGYVLFRMDDAEGALAEVESALTLAPEGAAWRQDAENLFVRASLLKSQREQR